jgi:hypothetical protein
LEFCFYHQMLHENKFNREYTPTSPTEFLLFSNNRSAYSKAAISNIEIGMVEYFSRNKSYGIKIRMRGIHEYLRDFCLFVC